jgi:Spy/CpxP family protein refolding chaperone
MKYTKIIVALVLAGVFAFAPASIAAEKKGKKKPEAGAKAKGKGNPILEKLGLSDDQKKEFMALQKETAAKRKEAGKDKDAQKAVQADFQAKLKEILTEEQQATYKKLQAEMRKGGKDAPKKGKKKKSDN